MNYTYKSCSTLLRYIDERHYRRCRLTDVARVEVVYRQARYVAMNVIHVFPSQLALIKKNLKEEVRIIRLNRDIPSVISSRIVLDKGKQQLSTYILRNFEGLSRKFQTIAHVFEIP